MKTIDVEDRILACCSVTARNAADLTRQEVADLTYWCDCQTEDLWAGLTLQAILNIYRASAKWTTWEDWRDEEPAAAVEAWNRIVPAAKRF